MSESPRGPRYGQPNFEYIARMAATPPEDDGPIFMVNLMKYRAVASYADGNPPGRSGREADDIYAPTEILRDIGAEIVFVADVERQILGDDPKWDRVAIVKYPTRASFLGMQRRPDFREKHVHKDAGMEQTIVVAGRPSPLPAIPGTRDAGTRPGRRSLRNDAPHEVRGERSEGHGGVRSVCRRGWNCPRRSSRGIP